MTLKTERLILRPFSLDDASEVQRLAGHPEIAKTTATVPHPYLDGMAEEWIAHHENWRQNGANFVFAVTLAESGELVGAISLGVRKNHQSGELGYWVGHDFWNRGICTEAVMALLEFGFKTQELNRIEAYHLSTNPSSGRVMEKNGMKLEGVRRQSFNKDGQLLDMALYAILRSEWSAD